MRKFIGGAALAALILLLGIFLYPSETVENIWFLLHVPLFIKFELIIAGLGGLAGWGLL